MTFKTEEERKLSRKESNRKYYLKNRELRLKKQHIYDVKNKDLISKKRKEYYLKKKQED